MLRIISYNIYFGRRMEKILAWLQQADRADIVCFQEFPKHSIASCVRKLSDTPYRYRFAPSLKIKKNIYGELTLFRADRIHLVSSTIIPLGTNRMEKTVLRNTISRSCLSMVMETKRKRFTIVNTQLICMAGNAIRYRQTQHIISSIPKQSRRSIIVGDFNVSSILGRKKLFTLMRNNLYESSEKRMSTHRLIMVKHQLDYVFAKGCKIIKLEVPRVRFSDHYPVVASVRLSH